MRLIVACNECKRQYDATGREVGSRFRCHCSAALTVEAPQGHDARVVRCSACGAPRVEDSSECTFCHSRFTLHERDLHTVCPSCLTRISDRAKFCHSCGDELSVEMAVGEITEMQCPSCEGDHRLTSRKLGSELVAVMECQTCAGLWLARDALSRLAKDVQERTAAAPKPLTKSLAGPLIRQEAADRNRNRWSYRPCIVCEKLMHRTQYDRGSGVIIDVCKDHGVWFDAHELAEILAWIRARGPEQAAERAREQEKADELNKRITRSASSSSSGPWSGVDSDNMWAAGSAVQILTRMFF